MNFLYLVWSYKCRPMNILFNSKSPRSLKAGLMPAFFMFKKKYIFFYFYSLQMERVERIELSSKGWKPLIIAIIRYPLAHIIIKKNFNISIFLTINYAIFSFLNEFVRFIFFRINACSICRKFILYFCRVFFISPIFQ